MHGNERAIERAFHPDRTFAVSFYNNMTINKSGPAIVSSILGDDVWESAPVGAQVEWARKTAVLGAFHQGARTAHWHLKAFSQQDRIHSYLSWTVDGKLLRQIRGATRNSFKFFLSSR